MSASNALSHCSLRPYFMFSDIYNSRPVRCSNLNNGGLVSTSAKRVVLPYGPEKCELSTSPPKKYENKKRRGTKTESNSFYGPHVLWVFYLTSHHVFYDSKVSSILGPIDTLIRVRCAGTMSRILGKLD